MNNDSLKDVGHDTHSMWQEAVKKHKEQLENQNKEDDKKDNLFDKIRDRLFGKKKEENNNEEKQQEKSELEKKQEQYQELGEKESFDQNREMKRQQLEDMKKEMAKMVSSNYSTNSGVRNVQNIGVSRPIVDWRYVLREAVKYNVDWSYKNATIEDGFLVPHLEEYPQSETEIMIDTSGSIDETLLKNFLKECKNILKYSKLKVGCFDTKFYGFNEIKTEKDIDNMHFLGGGNTDFNAAVNAFSKRVENRIIFTDGYGRIPDMQLDAIWILFNHNKSDYRFYFGDDFKPKGGRIIEITDEQLDRLISSGKNRTR